MNMHKNARLTPKGRELLIERLDRGEHPNDVASAMGVSVRTVYKWRRRYRNGGLTAKISRLIPSVFTAPVLLQFPARCSLHLASGPHRLSVVPRLKAARCPRTIAAAAFRHLRSSWHVFRYLSDLAFAGTYAGCAQVSGPCPNCRRHGQYDAVGNRHRVGIPAGLRPLFTSGLRRPTARNDPHRHGTSRRGVELADLFVRLYAGSVIKSWHSLQGSRETILQPFILGKSSQRR